MKFGTTFSAHGTVWKAVSSPFDAGGNAGLCVLAVRMEQLCQEREPIRLDSVTENLTECTLESIRYACRDGFATVTDEKSIQAELDQRLRLRELAFRREKPLCVNQSDIVDFLVHSGGDPLYMSGCVIEVKIQGSRTALLRQLERYSRYSQVEALLVVTPRARLLDLPETLGGKELRAVHILRRGAP